MTPAFGVTRDIDIDAGRMFGESIWNMTRPWP